MDKLTIRISPTRITMRYSDKMAGVLGHGKAKISRASYVEPYKIGETIKWQADMSPVGGGVIGQFSTRQQALDAESEWVDEHVIRRTR
jgi:hypothetical protein